MKNKSIHKIFSFTLSIFILLALMPAMTSFAWATEETPNPMEEADTSAVLEDGVVLDNPKHLFFMETVKQSVK